tara:strand:+ start:1597 stop:2304 length:708 start_codon:yes stop_codon:yes gene_type:complete
MANPTTNYGFVLPTATDLVTDLPADFDVALQGVDTRLKALQPGTTLGDLAYSSATANTNTRLGIGSTGNVLTVSGGVPVWAAPAGGGKVLQVVQGSTTTATSITATSYTDTTLTATITPSSASSKVLVILSQMWSLGTAANAAVMGNGLQLVRGATSIIDFAPNGYDVRWLDISGLGTGKSFVMRAFSAHTYLDAPATTSATTYKTQAKLYDAAYSMQMQNGNAPSTIILMEIGA